nr:probable xyloglucan endotransglucosylase/hydrolase protein 23 isoform X2 [Coffea arabica]
MISLAFFKASFLLQISIIASFLLAAYAGNFYQDVAQNFGDQRFKILEGGQLLTLSLDKTSGSGFQSKNEYLFGRFDMQLKLIPGNSADDWATQGGRVETDWTLAPFTVSYRNFNVNGCVKVPGSSACGSTNSLNNDQAWQTQGLDAKGRNRI